MIFFKRVIISLGQRRMRTLLFLGLFFIVFVLVLSGLAIVDSVESNKVEVRKQLGAEVLIKRDNDKIKDELLKGNTKMKPLTKDFVEKIKKFPEVKDVLITGQVSAVKGNLISVEPNKNSNKSNLGIQNSSEIEPSFQLFGTNNLKKMQDFRNHDATLIDGKEITEKTPENSAVVEETFSQNNKLKIGDKFKVQVFTVEGVEKEHEYEVIGIYKNKKEPSVIEQMYEMFQPGNQIYIDISSFLKNSKQTSIDNVSFYLKDPTQVNNFVKKIDQQLSAEKSIFKADAHTEQYEQMIEPLERMASFSSVMIKVIIISGGVILTLVSLLSIRDRKKEVGILLALGETKTRIILQLILEMLVIGILSFAFSLMIADSTGQAISDKLISQQVEKPNINTQEDDYESSENPTIKPVSKMKFDINKQVIYNTSELGFILILLATLIPSIIIVKTDPKDLFSKNE